jgi:hypothetical protein
VWAYGRSNVNLAGTPAASRARLESGRMGVAPQAHAERRSFSEALSFGNPGVGYEFHHRAEEVEPEAPKRKQGMYGEVGKCPAFVS